MVKKTNRIPKRFVAFMIAAIMLVSTIPFAFTTPANAASEVPINFVLQTNAGIPPEATLVLIPTGGSALPLPPPPPPVAISGGSATVIVDNEYDVEYRADVMVDGFVAATGTAFVPENHTGDIQVEINYVAAPRVSVSPETTGVLRVGQTVTFIATAVGLFAQNETAFTFEWYRNGMPIGENSPTFTTPALSLVDAGVEFSVEVTGYSATPGRETRTVNVSKYEPTLSLLVTPAGSLTLPGNVVITATLNDANTVAGKDIVFTVIDELNGREVVRSTRQTNASGVATFVFETARANRTYTFRAEFAGDDYNVGIFAEIEDYSVRRGGQNALHITGIASSIIYGDTNRGVYNSFDLGHTGGSGTGEVTFTLESEDNIASISDAGRLTITGVGSFTVVATRAADDNFNQISSAPFVVDVNPRALTIYIVVEDKPFDGLPYADIYTATLDGIVPGDEDYVALNRTNVVAFFESIGRGLDIPIRFEGLFEIYGNKSGNYTLTQPTGVTANIELGFLPERDEHYTITQLNAGWTNDDFVITARPGYLISLEETAEGIWQNNSAYPNNGAWEERIVFPLETSDGSVTFFVRNIETYEISQYVTQSFSIDRVVPSVEQFIFTRTDSTPFQRFVNILTFGLFFNDEISVTVTAAEARSGIISIQMYGHPHGGTPHQLDIVSKDLTNRTATFTIPSRFRGIVSAVVTSTAGNRSMQLMATTANSNLEYALIQIENIAPTINIDVAPAVHTANGNDWYSGNIPMTITAGDADSGIRSVEIRINDALISRDINGRAIDANFFENQTHEEVFVINTSQGTRATDGSFRIDVVVVDNAGNSHSDTRTVFVDDTAPVVTEFTFAPEGLQDASGTLLVVEMTDYGFYFRQNTLVTITVDDSSPSAGIRSITHYSVCVDGGRSAERTVNVTNNQISFTIPADFKGQIYARATDNVNHTTADFVTPSSVIIASPGRHAAESNIIFERPATAFIDNAGLDLYANNVNVGVRVMDNFAGLRHVEWAVTSPHDTASNQGGTISIANDGTLSGSTGGWSALRTDRNLVTEMRGTLTVSNNSNAISVWVRITDRAGNISEETIRFSIDRTNPTIAVTYDNNSPDTTHTNYFNANRVATIVITERNFRAGDVNVAITNSEGVMPTVSAWSTVVNAANPDLSTHTATVTFSADGVYTWSVSYSDNANNAAIPFDPDSFTIDQTDPVIGVSFDNVSAENDNYFDAGRIATISITERNFDPDRVTITGTATDDGVPIAFPALGDWSSADDVQTASINFDTDGLYSFEVEVVDMAGNNATVYSVSEFYIDLTPPELVEDADTAHDGTVSIYSLPAAQEPARPFVFYDTNISHIIYTIIAYVYTEGEEHDGITIYEMGNMEVFANRRANGYTVTLPAEFFNTNGVYEIRATAYDMAGNSSEEAVHTYVVMRGIDMMAYVPSNVLETFNGIHMQAVNFPDIPIRVFRIEDTEFDISIGEVQLIVGDYEEEIVERANGVVEHIITIPNTFIARTFNEDDQVYDLPINVSKNPIRTVARMVINNVPPSGVFDPTLELQSGRGFYGVDEQEIRVINLSDGIDDNTTTVSVNGANVPFVLDADGRTITFTLERSPTYGHPWAGHGIRVTLIDTAGNEFTLEEVTNVYVGSWLGRYWIFFAAGGVLLIGGAVFVWFWLKRKKKMND